MRRLQLNLSGKALTLVAIPLVFQLAFVIMLAVLLDNARTSAYHQMRARQNASDLAQITTSMDEALICLTLYKSYGTAMAAQRYDSIMQTIDPRVHAIKFNTIDNPKQFQRLLNIEALVDTMEDEMNGIRNMRADLSSLISQKSRWRDTLVGSSIRFKNEIADFLTALQPEIEREGDALPFANRRSPHHWWLRQNSWMAGRRRRIRKRHATILRHATVIHQ